MANEEISKLHRFLRYSRLLWPARKIYSVILGIIRHGFVYEMKWILDNIQGRIHRRRYYKKLILSEEERESQRQRVYDTPVCFSILVPLYNTPSDFLREMMDSVLRQTYTDWQLCLADGSDAAHREVGEIVREYCDRDSRICYQALKQNGGISENTNACIQMAEGEYIVLFDHDDLLHEAALYELRQAIDEEGADFIYTDEAIFSKKCHRPDSYHFKTDFAPDDLRSNNYICHITCFATRLLEQIGGGFRKEFDGSQDFDLVLRLTEKAEKIVHIPKVLYFWRCHEASVASDISAKTYCIDAGRKAVEAHLERQNTVAEVCSSEAYPVIYRVTYPVQGFPLVSVIVWGRKDSSLVDACIASIREHTGYSNYEILSCDTIEQRNRTACQAKGEYLVFLDALCRCRDSDWLEELLGVAQRGEIGVVGSKVLYAKGSIRDAGLTLGSGIKGVAVNRFYRVDGDNFGHMGNLCYTHNVSAVADSCIMIRKQLFDEVGGFDAELPEWYAGIDFSLRLREKGKYNVLNPYARLFYQREEHSRDYTGGYPECAPYDALIKERWASEWKKGDPYYNNNLTRKTGNFTIG